MANRLITKLMTPRGLLWSEIAVVLLVTFGMSGLRAVLKLVGALLDPAPLNEQSVAIGGAQASVRWLDVALQLTSVLSLLSWAALVLVLGIRVVRPRASDAGWGAVLAACIGLPGLVLYLVAVHMGWSVQVKPSMGLSLSGIVLALLWAAANALAEELVVVQWLATRLETLGVRVWVIIAASSLLRASYHLYQGVSAGFGNVVMGVVFAYVFLRWQRVWPLVWGHFLIDAVAFVGYPLLGSHLGL